jgi:hypothetical protein
MSTGLILRLRFFIYPNEVNKSVMPTATPPAIIHRLPLTNRSWQRDASVAISAQTNGRNIEIIAPPKLKPPAFIYVNPILRRFDQTLYFQSNNFLALRSVTPLVVIRRPPLINHHWPRDPRVAILAQTNGRNIDILVVTTPKLPSYVYVNPILRRFDQTLYFQPNNFLALRFGPAAASLAELAKDVTALKATVATALATPATAQTTINAAIDSFATKITPYLK